MLISPSEFNVERVVEVIQISDSPIAHGNDNSFVLIKSTDGVHVVTGQTNETMIIVVCDVNCSERLYS